MGRLSGPTGPPKAESRDRGRPVAGYATLQQARIGRSSGVGLVRGNRGDSATTPSSRSPGWGTCLPTIRDTSRPKQCEHTRDRTRRVPRRRAHTGGVDRAWCLDHGDLWPATWCGTGRVEGFGHIDFGDAGLTHPSCRRSMLVGECRHLWFGADAPDGPNLDHPTCSGFWTPTWTAYGTSDDLGNSLRIAPVRRGFVDLAHARVGEVARSVASTA